MEKPVGVAASLSDIPKAVEPGKLEQVWPQELSRVQELAPANGEKARLSKAPGSKKSLSMLHYIWGTTHKDIPVLLSHSTNGKSKLWEPFVVEEFAHQFHESVLQSTQKALQKHKGRNEATSPHWAPSCG
ncbi:Genetic suppressor element 1 [Saguinus oedipus]|uniref:Genetic suppressor element 1 n=1 Tax=Saguinus oedipus TaxID=9490 RepID=A0ABQ9VY17_SAGOE|nr:Genetic suppressor element 1 [Saguinus oedipus]